ncbi:hypothetical protein Tco_0417040 [Tanacetum coccineum]
MIRILLMMMRGRQERKEGRILVNLLLDHQRRTKLFVVPVQEDTPADQPQDQEEDYIQKRPNARWFNKTSGSTEAARRKLTWFDMLLKSNIDPNEDYILGPSTVVVAKKLKVLINKDELAIAHLEGARLEKLKEQYKNNAVNCIPC